MIKVFEAFAGIGSQVMALRNIGLDFEVVGISEVDRYALIAYDAIHGNGEPVEEKTKEEMLEEFAKRNVAYNFSTGKSEVPTNEREIKRLYEAHVRSKNYGDIARINPKELPDFSLFTYSFPCKNISIAGKQASLEEGSGTQSSLIWECRKIIQTKKPKYLLMENVKNLVGIKHKPLFDLWCAELEDMGYSNYWKVLNGRDFGIPQNRERVIMVSILNEGDSWFEMPTSCNKRKELKDIVEEYVDERYYVKKEDGMLATLTNVMGYEWNNTIIDDTQGFDRDEQNRKIPRIYIGYAPSLRALRCGLKVFDPSYNIRKLTPLEYWRLMGYTDEDFNRAKGAGLSNTKLYERAGRGIVVPMLEAIFSRLLK